MTKAAIDRRELYDTLHSDHDLWCERLHYTLLRKAIKGGFDSIMVKTLFETIIQVRPKRRKKLELEDISHEICHDLFHPDCFAHRDTRGPMDSIEEQQAEMFSSIICLPDISQYETEDQILMTSGHSLSIVQMRLQFFKKNGW